MANVSGTNLTGLYSSVNGVSPIFTDYGNANVVGLLAEGTDGANTITNISATGNVDVGAVYTDNYYYANGQPFTGGGATYGNANVVTLMAGFGSNTISTTGNISGGYFVGNGALLTGITTSTYGNSNVAAYLPTYTGNLNPGNVTVTTAVRSATVSASGNVTGGNVLTAGLVSATGNITGNYILGNGSLLTGLPATYGNSNVVNLLAGFGSNVISTSGNVTAGNVSASGNVTGTYFIGNGSQLTGLPASYSDANVTTLLASFGSNTISTTGNVTSGNVNTSGNVTGNYILGNGSLLTGLPATYGNSNVATFLAAYGSNNISSTGNVTAGKFFGDGGSLSNITATVGPNISVTGNIIAGGNINGGNIFGAANVSGTIGDFDTLHVAGNISAVGSTIFAATANLSSTLSAVGFVRSSTGFTTSGTVSAQGNITGDYILGNGSQLTNIALPSSGTNLSLSGNLSATGNVVATGNIQGGNITSLNGFYGTLHGPVTTSGTVSADGNITGGNIITGGVVNATGRISTSGNVLAGGNVSATGNITGAYFVGNGSALTGISTALSGAMVGNITGGNTYAITGLKDLSLTDTGSNIAIGAVSVRNFNNNWYFNNSVLVNGTMSAVGVTVGGNANISGSLNATGNVNGTYITGNGSALTGMIISSAGALTGNLDGANTYSINNLKDLTISDSGGNISIGAAKAQNFNNRWLFNTGLDVSGAVSATGNVYGSYFVGNGSALTGVTATLPSTISVSGNITGGNILTPGLISATGDVTANQFVGSGAGLTNIPAGNITGSLPSANAASYLVASNTAIYVNVTDSGTSSTVNLPRGGQILGNIGNINSGNETVIVSNAANGSVSLSTPDYKSYVRVRAGGVAMLANVGGLANATVSVANTNGAVVLAGANVNINTNLTGGNVTLQGVTFPHQLSSAGGNVNFGNKANISVGNISVQGLTTTGSLTLNGGTFSINSINLGNDTNIGYILGGNLGVEISTANSSDLALRPYGGNITLEGTVTNLNGNLDITASAGNVVALTNAQLTKFNEVVYSLGSSAGNISPDLSNGSIQTITLIGNMTFNDLTNVTAGSSLTLVVTQDGTGGRTMSSTMKFAGNARTLSTAANATDIISVFYDGSTYYASLTLGYA